MPQNQIVWTDSMIIDLITTIKKEKAHIKTSTRQEVKFEEVYNKLKDSRNFLGMNLSSGAPQAKWKSLTQMCKKKYIDENANLSGLEEQPSEATKIILKMMEEVEKLN
jgi:hypothetical protein